MMQFYIPEVVAVEQVNVDIFFVRVRTPGGDSQIKKDVGSRRTL